MCSILTQTHTRDRHTHTHTHETDRALNSIYTHMLIKHTLYQILFTISAYLLYTTQLQTHSTPITQSFTEHSTLRNHRQMKAREEKCWSYHSRLPVNWTQIIFTRVSQNSRNSHQRPGDASCWNLAQGSEGLQPPVQHEQVRIPLPWPSRSPLMSPGRLTDRRGLFQ